jgi:DNA-directed RNA polymerase specialized sigma24 family protein
MIRLVYFVSHDEYFLDWRIPVLNELEKYIVYESCQNKIYGLEPDDIAQELRVLLWNKLPTWQGRSNVRTWANKVMKNKIKDIRKFVTKTQKRKDYLSEPFENFINL